jgi:hypothetical protein
MASICESVLFPVFTQLGSLYAPGPGPSTFLGLRWSLLLMLELNLEPNEKIGPCLGAVIVYAPGPKPSLSRPSSFFPSVFFDAKFIGSLIILPSVYSPVFSGCCLILVSAGPGQSFLFGSSLPVTPNLN